MKKLLIFAVALVGVLCFSACENNENGLGTSYEPIPTSYWLATLSDGSLFSIGIQELTKEDKDDLPSDLRKCTNEIEAHIASSDHPIYSSQLLNGLSYWENNQIIIESYIRDNGEFEVPKIYNYDGNSLSCTLEENGETVQFTQITKEEYDDTQKI